MNTWQETEYLMVPILTGVSTIPTHFAREFWLTYKSKQPLELRWQGNFSQQHL